jgi:hypothetical protein
MVSERKKKSKRCISSVICLTLVLALFPLTGKAASSNGGGILDSLINANNPLPLDGQSLLDAAQSQADESDGKKDKNKSSKVILKDHPNSTSTKPANSAD